MDERLSCNNLLGRLDQESSGDTISIFLWSSDIRVRCVTISSSSMSFFQKEGTFIKINSLVK